ncbi:hypothetical protein RHGRI_035625 [Rhododendron griersonianum]|uniref:Uncharacterized protein n=1 Tax=Rhododendron griersonianum TaxID=479676 RepID=A0AAV6HNY5_9ERIC|nr:hypothetical protein RHGRI_035625 [Rhododendron griersonianum]
MLSLVSSATKSVGILTSSPVSFEKLRFEMLGENHSEGDGSEWYNELRAMEAEVNVYTLKMIPVDQEIFTLAHQVCCLAMLFDFYMAEGTSSSQKRKSASVVDVGLCKLVNGIC